MKNTDSLAGMPCSKNIHLQKIEHTYSYFFLVISFFFSIKFLKCGLNRVQSCTLGALHGAVSRRAMSYAIVKCRFSSYSHLCPKHCTPKHCTRNTRNEKRPMKNTEPPVCRAAKIYIYNNIRIPSLSE